MSEPTTTLAALADVNPSTPIPTDRTVSFVGMEDVSESFRLIATHERSSKDLGTGYTRFRDGDLLFAKITPCMENGKGARVDGLANGLGMGSTEFHVLRPRGSESTAFIAQWLASSTLRRAAERHMTGSAGQRRVPSGFFAGFEIPSLSIPERQAVGSILDAIDARIAAGKHIVAKLKSCRSGVLEDLVGGQASNATLAEALLGSPANGIYKPGHLIGQGVLLVGQTAFTAERRVDPTTARRAVVTRSELQRFRLLRNDILVSRVFATLDGVGQPALVDELTEDAVFESNMMRIRCNVAKADALFIFQTLLTSSARAHIVRRANLSNQASISQSVLTELPIWLPSLPQQRRVAEQLHGLDSGIYAEQSLLAKLAAEKEGLLADLLSGRVRVPVGAFS